MKMKAYVWMVLALAAMIMAGCTPDSISDLSPHVGAVSESEYKDLKIATIDLKFQDVWSESSYLLTAGTTCMNVSEGIAKNWPDKYDRLMFRFYAPLQDRYGNSNQEEVLQLGFTGDTIKRVNWDNLLYQRFLNLSSSQEPTPVGADLITSWCRDGNREYAETFCLGY